MWLPGKLTVFAQFRMTRQGLGVSSWQDSLTSHNTTKTFVEIGFWGRVTEIYWQSGNYFHRCNTWRLFQNTKVRKKIVCTVFESVWEHLAVPQGLETFSYSHSHTPFTQTESQPHTRRLAISLSVCLLHSLSFSLSLSPSLSSSSSLSFFVSLFLYTYVHMYI